MRHLGTAFALLLVSGCTGERSGPSFASRADFITVARPRPAAAAAAAQGLTPQSVPGANAPESFYLALNRDRLGERYFASVYLKDYFPGTVGSGAANSLGIRVVTFRIQNNKLFMFDASDNFATSDTFDPELIIEAYPIVTGFDNTPGADRYVVFDPAAGLNRFGVLSDAFAAGSKPVQFHVELAYMQNFRNLDDGATFEQVFVGYSDGVALNDPSTSPDSNAFRASGTLGMALRRYAEGEGYMRSPLPPKEHYFRSDPAIVKNTGTTFQSPAKWNTSRAANKPIRWLISDQFVKLQQDPKWAPYDIVGAVKRGIENWNAVFGYQALEAVIASPDDSYANDDTNYIIYDADPTYGYAFANWRTNPNTGEIRGASVYFNGIWLTSIDELSDDMMVAAAPATQPSIAAMTWGNMRPSPLCTLLPPTVDKSAEPALRVPVTPSLTKKEKFEAYLTHVINHEVGHTLGLRHNFKGSLVPISSSVMDYMGTEARTHLDKPQAYDIAAIKWLYGLASDLPMQPFCTDEDVLTDPNCSRFDAGATPLTDFAAPNYGHVLDSFLKNQPPAPGVMPVQPNISLNVLLKWVRGGTVSEATTAFNAAVGALKVPVDPNLLNQFPGYGQRADLAAQRMISRLYLDAAKDRADTSNSGAFLKDPPYQPMVTPLVVAEVKANLVNGDNIRSYATRRVAVAALKKMQATEALTALIDAKKTIAAARGGMTGDDATLTDELLSRIDAAISNYFNQ